MELQNFGLHVRPATEEDGYVLFHSDIRTEYSIYLINENKLPCDCILLIDGAIMGKFRINSEDSIRLERPSGEARKFTFVPDHLDTEGLITKNKDLRGLIQATFKPGRYPVEVQEVYRDIYTEPKKATGQTLEKGEPVLNRSSKGGGQSVSSGGTVLGTKSNQKFSTVENLMYTGEEITLYLRCIANEPIRPQYKSLHTATAIPRPID